MANNKANKQPFALKMMQWLFKVLTPIIPGIMGNYAYKIWFTPQRTKLPLQEVNAAQKAKASFIEVDGCKIRVWSWGEGPTVLFIHGWGGRGTQISSFIEPLNQKGFRVMSFDMPAHGESQGIQTNVFIIAKVLNQIVNQIDNFHGVITHSFGGIVLGHSFQSQAAPHCLVLICPPAVVHTALNKFSDTLKLPKAIQQYISTRLKKDFGDDVFDRLSLVKNASIISQPVLIVHDKDDDFVPYQDGEVLVNALQNGTLFETKGFGHIKILFEPTIVERIVNFITAE